MSASASSSCSRRTRRRDRDRFGVGSEGSASRQDSRAEWPDRSRPPTAPSSVPAPSRHETDRPPNPVINRVSHEAHFVAHHFLPQTEGFHEPTDRTQRSVETWGLFRRKSHRRFMAVCDAGCSGRPCVRLPGLPPPSTHGRRVARATLCHLRSRLPLLLRVHLAKRAATWWLRRHAPPFSMSSLQPAVRWSCRSAPATYRAKRRSRTVARRTGRRPAG